MKFPVKNKSVASTPITKKKFAVKTKEGVVVSTPKVVEKETLPKPPKLMLEFDGVEVPEKLTEIMYCWRLLGNRYLTPLEADLEISSRNIDAKIDDTTACRVLAYLGYMFVSPKPASELWVVKYKLTPKGMKVLSEKYPARKKVIETEEGAETVTCSVCGEGEGFNEETGTMCDHCGGTGTEPTKKTRSKGRVSSPEKTAPKEVVNGWPLKGSKVIFEKADKRSAVVIKELALKSKPIKEAVEPKMVDCERCTGVGLYKGRICPDCDGNGEVVDTVYADKLKQVIDSKVFGSKLKATKKFTIKRGK